MLNKSILSFVLSFSMFMTPLSKWVDAGGTKA